ncbi:hypothetical protein SAMN05216366_14815 [Selenomonas ruminantium]|uniref:O-antigen ligase like membrane protein n=2 Tax=Selenomonas ruminantium TaxID=971 RepID=A0A1H0VB83_SELRU|nr:hypothetical protein SAMN05216366_14815 [Selenomonas ruminantium]
MIEIFQLIIVVISIPILLFFIPYCIKNRNLKSLKYLTIVLLFQNILSLFASNAISGSLGKIIILYKDIILWGIVILYTISSLKIRYAIIPLLFFCIYLLLEFLQGSVDMYTRLVCFRQLLTPVILIIYGRALKLRQCDIYDYTRFLIKLGLYQAVFGLVERLVLGDEFWISLNISTLFDNKGFSKWAMSGLPGNYYSFDFYLLIGEGVKRLVGITTDPLLTAHYLALCLVFLIITGKEYCKNIKIAFFFILVATVLTLSKGGMLIIVVAYICLLREKSKKISYVAFMVVALGLFVLIQNNLLRTLAIHILGITSAFENVSMFGNGIGTAGNLASLGGGSITAGESFWGLILGQLGVFGLILFVFMISAVLKAALKYNKEKICYAVIIYVIAVMIEGIVSESAINYVGSGCGFIMLGVLSKNEYNV